MKIVSSQSAVWKGDPYKGKYYFYINSYKIGSKLRDRRPSSTLGLISMSSFGRSSSNITKADIHEYIGDPTCYPFYYINHKKTDPDDPYGDDTLWRSYKHTNFIPYELTRHGKMSRMDCILEFVAPPIIQYPYTFFWNY